MKTVKYLEESFLSIQGNSEIIIENETKEKNVVFLVCYQVHLGASLFGHLLAGKSVVRVGKSTYRAGQDC